MTSKVAFQALKRRKMGYDVDFLDDSGVPMDGIELDSSSSSAATGTVSRVTSSPSLSRPSSMLNSTTNNVSNSHQNNGLTKTNYNHNIASTTNSETTPANSSTSDQRQQNQLQSQQQQALDSQQQKTTTNLMMNMTENEAMTKDDEGDDPSMLSYINQDAGLKFSGQNSPDFGQTLNDYRMLSCEMFPVPDKGQQSSSEKSNANNAYSNNQSTNNSGGVGGVSSQKSIVRSFGDLFDDDDLD